jgi:hypothetical protein
MAVRALTGDSAGVLLVTGSLADTPTFTAEHLR